MKKLLVKRVFGVKGYGDNRWRKRCSERGFSPEDTFPADIFGSVIHVHIGSYTFLSSTENNTFIRVVLPKKDLEEYL